jgi:hypothetical protein
MSGGSYDYFYSKVEDFATSLRLTSPLRKAFKAHMIKVARACEDIEWVDSGDCGTGDEDKAIMACLGKDGPAMVLAECVKESERVKADLDDAIEKAKGKLI